RGALRGGGGVPRGRPRGPHKNGPPSPRGGGGKTNPPPRHSGNPAAVMRWHSSVNTSCDSGALRAPWTSHSTTGCSESGGGFIASPQIQILEEVVALVVNDDKGRKIDHFNAPDRFHAELGIFDAVDFLDAMFRKIGRRTADRSEIETAVLFASLAYRWRAVALGQRYHRAAGGLEIVDEGIHPPGRGRPERARGIAGRCLRRTGIIDRMVLEIIGQPLAALQPLAQLCVGKVARHDHRPGQRQPRLDRM